MIYYFKGLSIKARLYIGFNVVLFLMVVLSAIGAQRVSTIKGHLDYIASSIEVKASHIEGMTGSLNNYNLFIKDTVLIDLHQIDDLEMNLEQLEFLDQNYKEAYSELKSLTSIMTDEELNILKKIEAAEATARPAINNLIEHRKDGDIALAKDVLLMEASPSIMMWSVAINEMSKHLRESQSALSQEVHGISDTFLEIMVVFTLLAIILGLVISRFITKLLISEIGSEPRIVKDFTTSVGDGNFVPSSSIQAIVDVADKDSIIRSLYEMTHKLERTVVRVRESANTVSNTTQTITDANHELAARTEQQSSALTETATAMEELGATVRHNSQNASEADRLAAEATNVAAAGGQLIKRVVETMSELESRSRRIAEIISVMDGISLQTNILALNASVEAARAGEQGRGFAVVAQEVRSLAQRSADAARNINDIISENVEHVRQGTELVNQAGKATDSIVEAIQKVSHIMSEISTASQEQSTGVEQVGMAISQMDQATQQNSVMVNESAEVVGLLTEQADELIEAMASFKLRSR